MDVLDLGMLRQGPDLNEQLLHLVEGTADQHRQQRAGRRHAEPGAELLRPRDLPFRARLLQALRSGLFGLLTTGTVFGHVSRSSATSWLGRRARGECRARAEAAGT